MINIHTITAIFQSQVEPIPGTPEDIHVGDFFLAGDMHLMGTGKQFVCRLTAWDEPGSYVRVENLSCGYENWCCVDLVQPIRRLAPQEAQALLGVL
ncbi:MAG: hypothetical protein AAGK74_00285 [Chloroflexota bacterium]